MTLSLRARLLFASLLLLPLLLGIAGLALNNAFKESLLSGEEERLTSQFYLILAAAEVIEGNLWMPDELTEPRFGQQNSGLYGFIFDNQGNTLWRSTSTALLAANNSTGNIAGHFSSSAIRPGHSIFSESHSLDDPLFIKLHDIEWEIEAESENTLPLRFVVAHSQNEFLAELSAYRTQLWQWLLLLTAGLLLAQLAILKYGMSPLRIITSDIDDIKSGKKFKLEGTYPKEIVPLTENINNLLQSEQQQRERYSNTLADLAHSLKTPLAVIQNTLAQSNINTDDKSQTQTIQEQIDRMNDIVGHQLKRATNAQQTLTKVNTTLAPIVERIAASLQKVYRDKPIVIQNTLTLKHSWQCDERDVFEILGNVLENACKYGATTVRINAEGSAGRLTVLIDDNGPGIQESQQKIILRRGARADTATPGQGIGLSVCVDIISSYGGSLELDTSPIGGTRVTISLPT